MIFYMKKKQTYFQMRVAPAKACRIATACAILHNIAIMLQETEPEDDIEVEVDVADQGEVMNQPEDGHAVRDHIVRQFFRDSLQWRSSSYS